MENLNLDNEKKKLEIEKLKREIKSESIDPTILIQSAVEHFIGDYKITKHKSNFYQTLQKYPKVERISTHTISDSQQISNSQTVEKNDFHKFVLFSNKLPDEIKEKAIIEIVSPVLKKEKYKWRGLYNGDIIEFTMKDEDYKNSILNKEVSFESGFFIECILSVKRVIDDLGIIQRRGYTVITVLGKVEDKKIIETEQGKLYKRKKKIYGIQGGMF